MDWKRVDWESVTLFVLFGAVVVVASGTVGGIASLVFKALQKYVGD